MFGETIEPMNAVIHFSISQNPGLPSYIVGMRANSRGFEQALSTAYSIKSDPTASGTFLITLPFLDTIQHHA